MRRGLLLINLGTPHSSQTSDVTIYLREFLTDKRVIDIPALFRYVLVNFLILPFRAKKSAEAYKKIWTSQGSPLLFHSQNLVNHLQKSLGATYKVSLGMRYGSPSIKTALETLKDCGSLTIVPLYPQYSSAATGSSIEKVMSILAAREVIPTTKIISEFYQHPAYIQAQAHSIKTHLEKDTHLLFSYHGIPERQLIKSGCKEICSETCPVGTNKKQNCYRTQCYTTSILLANELKLHSSQYHTSFQSRLGKTPWIKPYTDEMLVTLAKDGIKKLAIVCPSFVSDCLETLEEIGIQAKEQWLKLGGEDLTVIPCMNENPEWIQALAEIIMGNPDLTVQKK